MAHRLGTSSSDILTAVDYLRSGGVVGDHTETLYGLAAAAFNIDAVSEIYRLKGRPANNPLILHIHHQDQIDQLATTIPEALPDLWRPLAWTSDGGVEIKTSVPDIVRAGGDTVAIRLPSHSVLQQVLTTIDEPLAAPSANRSNHISPTTALHVEHDFPEDPFPILDAGPTVTGLESTVISLVGPPTVLRLGATSVEGSGRFFRKSPPTFPNNRLIPPALPNGIMPQNPFYIWSNQNLTTEDGVLLFGTPVPRGADHVWDLGDDPVQAGRRCMPLCVKWINHVFEICMWCFPTMIKPSQPTGWRSLIDFVATLSK